MIDLRHTCRLDASPDELFRLLREPRGLPGFAPRGIRLEVRDASDELLRPGSWMRLRIRLRGIPVGWIAFVTDLRAPDFIAFRWVNSPMRSFYHDYRLAADGSGTVVRELFQFEPPLGPIGRWVGRRVVVPWMERILVDRDRRVARRVAHGSADRADPCPDGRAA